VTVRDLFRRIFRPSSTARRDCDRTRLGVEPLEDRALPSVLFHDDMENGFNGWCGDNLWHQIATWKDTTPTTAWVYNQEDGLNSRGTYDTGYWYTEGIYDPVTYWVSTSIAGSLTSPPIDLTGQTQATLTFTEWRDIGTTFSGDPDHTAVLVSDGGNVTPVSLSYVAGSDWSVARADLTPFVGHVVSVMFAFDTVDEYDNAHGGWMIDDVTVSGGPAPVVVTVGDTTATESPTGAAAVFTVSLSTPSATPVTVHYATGDKSAGVWGPGATAGLDYTPTAGDLTFAPGETTRTVAVPILDDRLGEGDEAFSLNLSGGDGYLFEPNADGTILDDEPTVRSGDVTQAEGNTGSTTFNFPVRLSRAYDQPVTVHYATADESAVAGSDYFATAGDLTFAPGETEKIVPVTVLGDRVAEGGYYSDPAETFTLRLSGASSNASINYYYAFGVGAINDDEPRVWMGIDFPAVTEGDSGTTPMLFPVRLTVPYDVPITVTYAPYTNTATGDTAQAGTDYVGGSMTFTFAAGQTTGFLTVPVIGDRVHEALSESFSVQLTAATYAGFGAFRSHGFIGDNDPLPSVSIGDASVREGNAGSVYLVFTVTLSGPTADAVFVSYATADGTATTADHDYRAAYGTLTFAPGETTKTISILVYGDRKKEANETFFLNLSASGAGVADGQGVGTILNDD
jgi:hypothetical protein